MFGFESALRQLIRLGPDGTVRQAHPITMDPSLVGDAGEAVPSRQSFRLARSLGKPVYSKAYPYFTNDWQFEVRVPVSRDGRIGGFAPPNCRLPVIFLTGHGGVPMAVQAFKDGAFNFIEKPYDDKALVDKVLATLEHDVKRCTRESSVLPV